MPYNLRRAFIHFHGWDMSSTNERLYIPLISFQTNRLMGSIKSRKVSIAATGAVNVYFCQTNEEMIAD